MLRLGGWEARVRVEHVCGLLVVPRARPTMRLEHLLRPRFSFRV